MLVDSHCHLEFDEFAQDFEAVLERAASNNVKLMQTIGTRLDHFPRIIKIAEKYDNIYCSFGIHPHEAEKDFVDSKQIIEFCRHPKVIGIGETGLDYYYEHSPREKQLASFEEHIKAGITTQLPLIIHTRDAESETVELLAKYKKEQEFPALIHCFTGSHYLAEKVLDMGLYIAFSGIITFKKAEDLREIVKYVPLDRILVETDSPFLAPIPMRGKRNEPAFVKHTAELIAQLKGISFEEVAQATTDNFFRLFEKCKRV